jgi:Fe-S oxidoreductase
MRHLIDLRRERVLDEAEFPHELISLYRGLELRGNPWRLHEQNRIAWASDLDVPVLAEGNETDALLWIGCLTAYDDNQQRDARALVRVLRAAGVEFATLGAAERCCGDPGRRTGNEHLWAVLARQNIEVLQSRRFRCMVTLCPHCMNTLKNEYPVLDGRFEVAHAAKLVAKLIQEGRLPLNGRKPGLESASRLVTYHDPCYLARGNGSVGKADSVRSVLHALPGIELVEMAAHGRNAVCCGGGGGQMWLERPANQRVEDARADQILSTPASACLTACPYCTQMLNDGLNATDANIRARSWIELVSERVPE